MTGEEFMHDIRKVRRRIRMLAEQIERDRIMAAGNKAIRYDLDKVQTSANGDQMVTIVATMIENEQQFINEMVKWQGYEKKCRELLLRLKYEHERILTYHYLDDMNWAEVAKVMNYNEHYIYKIRDNALNELTEVLNK